MPELETLRQNDEALSAMYKGDTQDGETLSAEDEQAYKDLIAEQRNDYKDTLFREKGENGEVTEAIAPSIGEAAIQGGLTPAQEARAQFESAAEDWHNPKS